MIIVTRTRAATVLLLVLALGYLSGYFSATKYPSDTALAQTPITPTPPASATPQPPPAKPGTILLTIFLRHDQSKTLDEINQQLAKTGFHKNFPPEGTEVESWYVMMGVGQVVTLRLPPEKLRDVNLAIEHGAWGAFRTEFYPTYDYRAIAAQEHQKP